MPSVSAFVRRGRVCLSSRGFGSPATVRLICGHVLRRVEEADHVQLRRPALLYPQALGPPPCNRTEMAEVLGRQPDKFFERSAHRIWIFSPAADEIAVHLVDATHPEHAAKELRLVFVGQLQEAPLLADRLAHIPDVVVRWFEMIFLDPQARSVAQDVVARISSPSRASQRNDLAALAGAMTRPPVHEGAPLIEQFVAQVSALDGAVELVAQRQFGNLAVLPRRKSPSSKGRAKAVNRERASAVRVEPVARAPKCARQRNQLHVIDWLAVRLGEDVGRWLGALGVRLAHGFDGCDGHVVQRDDECIRSMTAILQVRSRDAPYPRLDINVAVFGDDAQRRSGWPSRR